MLDEKKIEEAASSSAEKNRWEAAISEDEVRNLCKKLFKAGAHWAIQEFLKGDRLNAGILSIPTEDELESLKKEGLYNKIVYIISKFNLENLSLDKLEQIYNIIKGE